MKIKEKPCKAMGKARGFEGCGKVVFKRTYGICDTCYSKWLLNTPEGKEKLSKSILQAPKTREKIEKRSWNDRKQIMENKLKTKQNYESELQDIVNTFIRLRDQSRPCISCPRPLIGKFDAGHYYPVGSYKNLRYDEDNIHGQCVHCNQHKHGNIPEYTILLPIRIGKDRYNDLVERRLIEMHYSIPELVEMKVNYKEKIRKLKKILD